jgi:phosphate transport system substrate-binding protein
MLSKRLPHFLNVVLMVIASTAIPCWSEEFPKEVPQTNAPKTELLQPIVLPAKGIVGNMSSIGSDTLASLMTVWSAEFNRIYPQAKIQIQTTGSSAAPIAITAGTASVGPMSRPLKPSERQSFINKYGYEPLMITVAIDAIGVFVKDTNPLTSITLAQLDGLYSATRYCAPRRAIDNWAELLTHDEYNQAEFSNMARFPVRLYGRNSASGTYIFFKQHALCNGDYKAQVQQLPSSSSIIQTVANGIGAMGYASVGYQSSGVKTLAIARSSIEPAYQVNAYNVQTGRYPLARGLYLMINQQPGKPFSPVLAEFLKFVLSDYGQLIVVQEGYFPIAGSQQQAQLNTLFDAANPTQ